MCGICGFLGCNNGLNLLDMMTETMVHRGPDDSGVFLDGSMGFGHRRLSIIDLSLGRQPMISGDGRYTLVYNGEIYNFRQLREELESEGYCFRTKSDTEVLLYAYHAYGIDCLSKINGMFTFAIWDRDKKEMVRGLLRAFQD